MNIVIEFQLLLLFIFGTGVNSQFCVDSTEPFNITSIGKTKSCEWAGRRRTVTRCQIKEVFENCPYTCNEICSLQNAPLSPCTDNTEPFYVSRRDKMQRCKWARRKNTSVRCKTPEIAENCPGTCDTDCLRPPLSARGCRDSPYSFQLISSLAWKTCQWAERSDTFKRCRRYPTKLWCPLTCGTCGNEPSASPTLSSIPTKSPTGLPSPSPTLSQVPSKAPTGNPTSYPTYICEDFPDRFYVQAPVKKYKVCNPWVNNNPSFRCTLTTGDAGEPTGIVSELCPKACGMCLNSPSAIPSRSPAPSLNPTLSPSETPSHQPSISPTRDPTLSPSEKPSHQPSISPTRDPSSQPSNAPSVVPSSQPSNEPSVCVDSYWEVNYEVSPGVTTKITCSNIGSFCTTDGIGTAYYNDKTASEACCICGGSLQRSVPPSLSPSLSPSSSPTECVNYPKNSPNSWTTTHDINNDGTPETYTCASFLIGQNCDPISTPGTDGKTASQACCACGGGNHIATAP